MLLYNTRTVPYAHEIQYHRASTKDRCQIGIGPPICELMYIV